MPQKTTTSSTAKAKGAAAKSTPKKPLPIPERLKRLFNSLCAQIDGGHFTNAIKTCEKILRLDPEDADAKQTKQFLLLQTEQYDAALSLIDLSGKSSNLGFEQAYALYRLQNEPEAKEALEAVKKIKGDSDRGAMHLEAQLGYRNGSYAQAVELYNELLETAEPDSEEYSDILTNLQAAQNHLEFIESGFRRGVNSLPTATVSSLESTVPPTQPSTSAAIALPSAAATSTSAIAAAPLPKEKKVRKSRVPAGVIPGVTPPPDPERWLKKSERSTFNQGRRRKGQGGGGATQGSAMVDSPNVASGGVSGGGGHAKKGKKKK